MEYILKATTNEGYCLKKLSDLLQYNIKTAYYEIESTGIHLKMADSKEHVFFDIDLHAENFFCFELDTNSLYSFGVNTTKLCFGVNQLHMYTMLKTIKKKDTVTLFITKDNPLELGIKIEPRERTRVSCSYIKILPAHNIQIHNPLPHIEYTTAIPSSEYSNTCKEMSKLSRTINIITAKHGIRFSINTTNIYSKSVEFGEFTGVEISHQFMSEYLSNITKLSGMSSVIHIGLTSSGSLIARSSIGSLGRIMLYVKSNSQILDDKEPEEDILEI
jgi:hypothetical protein